MTSAKRNSLRLGLYGAGQHSRNMLLPALASLEQPFEAICDPRGGLADKLAERFAFRSTFVDLPSMLRDSNVDGLIISRDAPNFAEIVETLLKSRLGFWIDAATVGLEKLIERLGRRSRKNGPLYMICHPYRFAPAFIRASELIRSARLGELTSGSLEICEAKAGAGQIEVNLEYLVEGAMDLLCFLLGRPETAYARWDGESVLTAMVQFGPVPVALQVRLGVWAGQAGHYLRLHGQQGQELYVRNILDIFASQGDAVLAQSVHARSQSIDMNAEHGWTGALASFFSAARQSGAESADMTGLLETRKLSQAVIRSASSKREVRFRV